MQNQNPHWRTLAFSFFIVALALTLVKPVFGANSAVVPVARTNADWISRHESMNQKAKQGHIDLIYVGDSIVEHFNNQGKEVWDHYYAGRNALNLGIGGDRTEHVLWRLDHGNIDGLAPKLAIVMIGQNNGGRNTGEEIGEGVTAIVQKIRTKLPNTKILLLGIFQRREKPTPERAVLARANEIASKLADDKHIFYVDINSVFVRPDGTISKSLMYDFEHPTPLGHRVWAEAIEPKVAELMGDKPVVELADIPVFKENTRILFQGDSITEGNRGRNEDPNHILGHGYCFIIAAQYGACYPERKLTFLNRGISGNKVTDLAARWQKDTLDLKPDVLSILVGINDSGHVPLEQYEAVYDQLLADARMANPNLNIVLCEPFYLPKDGHKEGDARDQDVQKRQAIVAKLAGKHHAALMKFQQVFDDACQRAPAQYWVWDAVHPTYSGHQLMADEWVRTVSRFYSMSVPTANDRATTPRPASPK